MIKDSDLAFDSANFIKDIKEPISILHAKDDKIVPYELGEKLYQIALNNSCNVRFFPFENSLGLGHENIYKAKSLGDVVKEILANLNESQA